MHLIVFAMCFSGSAGENEMWLVFEYSLLPLFVCMAVRPQCIKREGGEKKGNILSGVVPELQRWSQSNLFKHALSILVCLSFTSATSD